MFLARVRRKVSFKELGFQFGCGAETARRYCDEMTAVFSTHMVPRLVFPRPPEELKDMRRAAVADAFPDLLAILDATMWEQMKPENFLENRLSYSAYKHSTVFQVLFGECVSAGQWVRGAADARTSRIDRKVDLVALGNLRGHLERDLGAAGRIYTAA